MDSEDGLQRGPTWVSEEGDYPGAGRMGLTGLSGLSLKLTHMGLGAISMAQFRMEAMGRILMAGAWVGLGTCGGNCE